MPRRSKTIVARVRLEITRRRAAKIAATQRGATPEELAELEERLYTAIWAYERITKEGEEKHG